MRNMHILSPVHNELVFENRNKNYGAYVLRKENDTTMIKAWLTVAGLMGLLSLGLFWNASDDRIIKVIPEQILPPLPPQKIMDVTVTPPAKKAERKTAPPPVEPPKKSDTPANYAVKDSVDEPLLAKVDDFSNTNVNANNLTGSGTNDDGDNDDNGNGNDDEDSPGIDNLPVEFEGVDVKPVFPGGEEALYGFYRSKVVYPGIARSEGIEGTVFLSFIVDETGNVTNIQVMRPVAGGCAEEAVRVTGLLPKWTPGQNKGKPVKVLYKIPVRFRLH